MCVSIVRASHDSDSWPGMCCRMRRAREGSSPGACRTAAMSLLAPLAAGTLPFWPQSILADDGSAASKPPGLIPPSATRDLSCACCLQAVAQAPGRGGRGRRGRGPPSRGGRSQDHGRSPSRGRSGGRGGRGCSGPPAQQQQQVRVHSSLACRAARFDVHGRAGLLLETCGYVWATVGLLLCVPAQSPMDACKACICLSVWAPACMVVAASASSVHV